MLRDDPSTTGEAVSQRHVPGRRREGPFSLFERLRWISVELTLNYSPDLSPSRN